MRAGSGSVTRRLGLGCQQALQPFLQTTPIGLLRCTRQGGLERLPGLSQVAEGAASLGQGSQVVGAQGSGHRRLHRPQQAESPLGLAGFGQRNGLAEPGAGEGSSCSSRSWYATMRDQSVAS